MTFMTTTFKAVAISAALVLPTLPAAAEGIADLPSGKYDMDLTHSSIVWSVSHFGLSLYKARFADFAVDLDFDSQDPTKSALSVSVDPTSIKTEFPYTDKEDFDDKLINGRRWFNAEQHPEITFVATDIEITGDDTGTVTGDLTFLGVTKPIEMAVTLQGSMPKHPFKGVAALGFGGTTTFKRSDFGMGIYVPNVGDEVTLEIQTEFMKAK